ncbi:MAG: FtsQ-type POTRA domain-containing protein [Acidimicrobiales bacterium]
MTGSTSTAPRGRAAAPIDPRIRARRIEVQRVEGRRRLQRVVDLGVLALVTAAFVGALWTPLLDVDEIRVLGARHTGEPAILEQAGIARGDHLISIDLQAAGRRLTALPWIADVALHRGVDGLVVITVEERSSVASIGVGTARMLVDRDGRILGPVPEAGAGGGAPSLIELTGVGSVPAAGGFLTRSDRRAALLAERLQEVAPGMVASLSVDGLVGQLAAGGEIRFGDGSLLEAKVRSLQTVLDQVDLDCLAVLDLRLPGSPVLTREERCS